MTGQRLLPGMGCRSRARQSAVGCWFQRVFPTAPGTPGPASSPVSGPETGAAVVETALVVPLVIVALLGVFETAFAWRDQVALVDAAAGAARVAALHPSTIPGWATDPSEVTGIPAVVAAARDGLGSVRAGSLEHVAIFAPAGPPGRPAIEQLPDRCRTSLEVSVTDRCVGLGADVLGGVAPLAASCEAVECPWRLNAPDGTNPRAVGVYLRLRRNSVVPGLGLSPVTEVAVLVPLEGGSGVAG